MTDRKPRPRLRRARLERGWGLAKAAEMFTGIAWHEGYLPRDKQATPGMFSKWESGEKAPRGWRVEVLVTLYGKPASELDLLDDSETIRYDTSHALAEQGTLDGMKRRAAIVSIASAALGVTADRVIPLVRTRESGIVTPESVQLVRDGVAHVHRMDDQLGASVAVDFAAKYLHIAGEQLTARPENSLRRHLLQLKGELEQFMGWSAFDAEADALARSWYERALVDANRADDMGLSAYILGHLAIVTTYAGQPAQALVFAEAAANRARQQVPAVRSWVGTAHAETLAALGQPLEAHRILDQALADLPKVKAVDTPGFLYYYADGQAEYWHNAGATLLRLGLAEDARQAMQRAMHYTSLPPDARDWSLHDAWLGRTFAAQGEIDEATRLGTNAYRIAQKTGSARAVRRVRDLAGELPQHDPRAKEFRSLLRAS